MLLKLLRQHFCEHDFKYIKHVFGFEGDIMMNQYQCTKCGRYDYLYPEDDPDYDWNHGKGDGHICNIFAQIPNEDL